MGNSNGNIHLYFKAFWDKDLPRLQGGFIWDMIDQGLRKKNKVRVFMKLSSKIHVNFELILW